MSTSKNGKKHHHRHLIPSDKKKEFKQWLWYVLWCSWFGHKIKGAEPCRRCGQTIALGSGKQ